MLQTGDGVGKDGAGRTITFEVTATHEIVWEYISPYRSGGAHDLNLVYRAYRAPYDWVPQLPVPGEQRIARIDPAIFRVPGAAGPGREREVLVQGVQEGQRDAVFCVAASGERSGG